MNEPSETADFHNPASRKLRLRMLTLSSVPGHAALDSGSDSSEYPSLQSFVEEVLAEALSFSDKIVPNQFQKKGNPKDSPPSTAQVQLLSSDLLEGEHWFARQSYHEDKSEQGTASWLEFENGLFQDHSANEAEYTPEVFDAFKVCDWEAELKSTQLNDWVDVAMEVREMGHRIPTPLQNRAFALLVVRGKPKSESPDTVSTNGFVTAQMPVDLSSTSQAMYSNGRHRTEGDSTEKKQKVTIGEYVSVERVKKLEDGKIMWEMALSSDAKGNLPMSVQKMGVPSAVIKDVGYFMKWVDDNRKNNPTA